MIKIQTLNKLQGFVKKVLKVALICFIAGVGFVMLGDVMSWKWTDNVMGVFIVLSYLLAVFGGFLWFFSYALKGYLEKKIKVYADREYRPGFGWDALGSNDMHYGTVARIWAVVIIVLTIFLFLCSLLPIYFILTA